MKTALVLALLAACGGDDTVDLGGVYMVTTDVSSAPCGMDMPTPMAPAYLHFKQDNVFGVSVWTYEGCSDAAATMCDSSGALFAEPVTNGWKGVETSDSFSGSECYLAYDESTALLTNKMIVVESGLWSDTPMLDEAHCTTDEAEKRAKTMPCKMHEHIEATKL
jgi:hypothetical protein